MPMNLYLIRTLFYFFYTKRVKRSLMTTKKKTKMKSDQVPLTINLNSKTLANEEEQEDDKNFELLNPLAFSDCSRLDYAVYSANAISSGKFEIMGFTSSESFVLTKSLNEYDPDLINSDHTDQKINSSANYYNQNLFLNHNPKN